MSVSKHSAFLLSGVRLFKHLKTFLHGPFSCALFFGFRKGFLKAPESAYHVSYNARIEIFF